jgi:hypothetical protein
MKLSKNNAIDKEAMQKQVATATKDAFWKPVLRDVVEKCYNDVTAKKDRIVAEMEKSPYNVRRDQCNVLFMAMITCVQLQSFAVNIS